MRHPHPGLFAIAIAGCATHSTPPGPIPASPAPLSAPALASSPGPSAEPLPVAAPVELPLRPAAPERPRLTSQARTTWIYAHPRIDARTYLGYVRLGTSVTLRSTERVPGEGCPGGFYPVEPRGFVCDDHTVTRAPSPHLTALAAAAAPSPGPFPYRYAFSDGAPMYTRIPSPDEQARAERTFGPADSRTHPRKKASTYDELASTDAVEPVEPAPPFLEPGDGGSPVRETIPRGSMLSFTRAYAVAGRTFLLSADLALVPADRVRIFRRSRFHGVQLGGDVDLPLAWVRHAGRPGGRVRASSDDRPQYRLLPGGTLEKSGGVWRTKVPIRLGTALLEHEGRSYRETRDADDSGAPLYVSVSDVWIVEPASTLPIGVKPGQKWILVRLGEGTLVAYEDLRPVFATLMSPGRGGVPVAGRDPIEASTTPLGVYYVTFKDRAADMSHDKPGEPRTHWIADVPFTQYFAPPFALHAAYWHDRFGEETSAGCINVSPEDAETLFTWSDPPVPPEWQGATGAGAAENGPTTAIVIRR